MRYLKEEIDTFNLACRYLTLRRWNYTGLVEVKGHLRSPGENTKKCLPDVLR